MIKRKSIQCYMIHYITLVFNVVRYNINRYNPNWYTLWVYQLMVTTLNKVLLYPLCTFNLRVNLVSHERYNNSISEMATFSSTTIGIHIAPPQTTTNKNKLALWPRGKLDDSRSECPRFDSHVRQKLLSKY